MLLAEFFLLYFLSCKVRHLFSVLLMRLLKFMKPINQNLPLPFWNIFCHLNHFLLLLFLARIVIIVRFPKSYLQFALIVLLLFLEILSLKSHFFCCLYFLFQIFSLQDKCVITALILFIYI